MHTAAVLGHFGHGQNLLNGQTIKTKIVAEELQRQLGEDQVVCIDTHGKLKTLLRAPFQVISALKGSKNVLNAACTMLSSAAGCRSFYQNANCLPAL